MAINDGNAKIFLSYAREDKGKALDLYYKLKDAGFCPWIDVEDLHPGEVWKKKISKTILSSTFFIICLSKSTENKRGILQYEISIALEIWQQKLEDDIYFIPVRLEECEVSDSIAKFQWVDIFTKDGFDKLIASLRKGMGKVEPEKDQSPFLPILLEPRVETEIGISEDEFTTAINKSLLETSEKLSLQL